MLRQSRVGAYGEQRPFRPLVVGLLLVFLLAAGLAAGFVVGRLTAGKAETPAAAGGGTNVRWPGASHLTKEGAPYGWPDTPRGAVQAASAVLQVIDSPLRDGNAFNFEGMYGVGTSGISGTEVTAWDGPGASDGPVHQARQRGLPSKTQGWPLAYKTDGCDNQTCHVRIWMTAVQAFVGVMPATQRWYTATLRMEWKYNAPVPGLTKADHDWNVQQASEEPGPIPQLLETPQVSRDQLPPGMTDWTPYGLNPAG